ncbi:hypothetical protein C5167_018613 [Papaver somniferum]|uniref:Uncharacterized protein n=1 Tax=Papaver somniferum TaxID=3469 RepID=A0A4Y7IPZ0_PAPSO|nr:hypothetical protein C5167_018613 [Papaver somniferum]
MNERVIIHGCWFTGDNTWIQGEIHERCRDSRGRLMWSSGWYYSSSWLQCGNCFITSGCAVVYGFVGVGLDTAYKHKWFYTEAQDIDLIDFETKVA